MRPVVAPVFIGGVAGSGKTRLGTVLGRNSKLSVTRKTYLWRTCHGRHGGLERPEQRASLVAAMLGTPGVAELGIDGDRLRAEILAAESLTYAGAFGLVHAMRAEQVGKPRWCDQLGLVEVYAGAIFQEWPDATVIHLVSDPRTRRGQLRPGWAGWDLGKWITSVRAAEANQDAFGDRYLVVHHEDLVADEAGTVGSICARLGLGLEPSMIADGDTTPGGPPPVRPDADFIEAACGELIRHIGYGETDRPTGAGVRRRLLDRPMNTAGLMAWSRWRGPGLERVAEVHR